MGIDFFRAATRVFLPARERHAMRILPMASLVVLLSMTFTDIHRTGASLRPTGTVVGRPVHRAVSIVAGDVNGDGAADLILVGATGVSEVPANPNWFVTPPQSWSTTPFHGTRQTLTADMDAEGDADLVAVNDDDAWVLLTR